MYCLAHAIASSLALFSLFHFSHSGELRGLTPNFDLTQYHDFVDIELFLRNVAKLNPEFVRLREIGKTYEGRKLLGVQIGYPSDATHKRAVWLDGGNHAREWPAFHVALYFINELVSKYGSDSNITAYVNQLNIFVFPVLNPDGYEYSRTSSDSLIRQWRKNRGVSNCSGTVAFRHGVCCFGVDINRNYDIAFSQSNTNFNNPCSDEFQGPHAFSEPESRAVRDFLMSGELKDKVDALVSLHTHGEMFILPYNYRRHTYPDDIDHLRNLAQRAAARIREFGATDYRIGTAADMLSPATGGATDWIKRYTSVKYVYVIELPPDLFTSFAFQVKPRWLVPTAEETWVGIRVIIDEVLSPEHRRFVAERKLQGVRRRNSRHS